MPSHFFLALILMITSCSVLAQYDNPRREQSKFGSRDGRFEGSVLLGYQTGISESGEGGSELDIDSDLGWGFTVGWNWTQHWNLSYRLLASSPKYIAVIVPEDPEILPQSIERNMSKYSHQFNVTYNFMDKAFTPYVVGGLGWTRIDSNFPSGPPQVGCWWDPWWGYICSSAYRTYATSEFTYQLGLGLRWEINQAAFTRASYSREFIKLDNVTLNFDTLVMELGLMF